ncbi:MAG TPA: fibronectin type III domain-containing protein, partial [Thermoanaerobaculia bacterium]|nr:fibronectin type III domain-containing protein [Thermoanaerobaculia bacterium]
MNIFQTTLGPGRRGLALGALLLASLSLPLAAQEPGGALPGPLPLFPSDNWWNTDISGAPVDPNSADYIQFIGPTRGLHPDFGGDADTFPDIYGMVYIVVPGTQPLVQVFFGDFESESDRGAPGRPLGYPIPEEAKTQPKWIEGGAAGDATGGDRHMLIVDRDNRVLYELYHTHWNAAQGRWEADSGAVFPLDANLRRPEGWTSADAAGLAILPGLVRFDEAIGTAPIQHAFRFTVRGTDGYVYPASHETDSTSGAPPMGMRLRLKAGKDISGYSPEVRKIFQAMKTYGLIVADNGSDMFISGAYNPGWNNDVLNPAFSSLKASDFEVIQLGWRPGVTPPPPSPPAAPSNLVATAQSSEQVSLAWQDNSSNEDSFRVELRTGSGAFGEASTVAANVSSTVISGLAPSTSYGFRVRSANSAGSSAYSNTATATTLPAAPAGNCVPSATRLCLNEGRFQVEVAWTTSTGAQGTGRAISLTADTGYFWFFNPANVELVVK